MSYIKVLRLKNGDDVISFVEESAKKINLRHPIIFAIVTNKKTQKYELILTHWLPVNILEKNQAELLKSDVLTILEPNESFKEYYLNFLNTFGGPEEELEDELEDESLRDASPHIIDNEQEEEDHEDREDPGGGAHVSSSPGS